MGQKVHPTGFRIGVIYDWQSKWFADQNYRELLQEDLHIRNHIDKMARDSGISKVEIDRNANIVTVTIHTAKPGIVIGRGGQKVDELRGQLEKLTSKRIRVNIQEIRMPELDAYLVARNIADQLERRVAFRRALKQTIARTMGRGAEGCKAMVAGRLGGTEMSRREASIDGRVPLHTLRADIDFGRAEAHTTFGRIGVKVWIYKGETLPEKRPKEEEAAAEETAEPAPTPAPAPAAEAAPAVAPAPAPAPAAEAGPAAAPAPAADATAAPEAAAPAEPQATAEEPPPPAGEPPTEPEKSDSASEEQR